MKRLFSIFAALIAVAVLAGCGTTKSLLAGTAAVAAVVAPSGGSADYAAYLAHCEKEVAAQRAAAEADSQALRAGLQSGNEKTQFGALILLAARGGTSPKIGCSVARKKELSELLLGDANFLELGVDLYRENRAEKRFRRQLDADKELAKARMEHEQRMDAQRTDLLTTLTGDKLEAFRAQAEADAQARQDAAAAAK